MIRFFKENAELTVMVLIWIIAGVLLKETSLVLVPLGLLLLKSKARYSEMFYAFFFLMVLSDNRHHELDFAVYIKDIALMVMTAMVLLDRKNFPFKSSLYLPFIPFLVLAVLLSFRHPVPSTSFMKVLSYGLVLTFIPDYFTRQVAVDGRTFLRNMLWVCAIVLATGLVFLVVLPEWPYLNERYNGLLGNPNGIGTFCCLFTILVVLGRYHYPDILTKNETRLIFILIVASVFLSRSRNGMFSILMFLFFVRFYKLSYWYGFVILITIAIVFQLVNENLANIVVSLGLGDFLRVDHLEDGSGRTIAWGFAWQEIQKNFLFGRGFAYEEYLFFINQEWLNALNHQGGVHNTYLAIWLNTGLVGLILFLYGFFRNMIGKALNNYLAMPAMFAIMFQITFEPWFQSSLNPFTSMALLIIVLLQYDQPLGNLETVAEQHEEEDEVPVPVS